MDAPASNRPRPWLALTLAYTALDVSARAVPTGVTSVQHTDLVVTALGHHADHAAAYIDPSLGHLRTERGGQVLDGTGRTLRHVYASGWAATGARGVLASTMLDAYAVADTILADHNFGDGGADAREGLSAEYSEDALVVDGVVDLESVAGEVEEGVRARRVVQYEQWKNVDAEEVRRGAGKDKERERMGWEEAHDFLTSTGAWLSP